MSPCRVQERDLAREIARKLAPEFAGFFSPETIERSAVEGYAYYSSLIEAGEAVANYLPIMTERFVRNRLRFVRTDRLAFTDVPEVLFGHLNRTYQVVGGLPIPGLASILSDPKEGTATQIQGLDTVGPVPQAPYRQGARLGGPDHYAGLWRRMPHPSRQALPRLGCSRSARAEPRDGQGHRCRHRRPGPRPPRRDARSSPRAGPPSLGVVLSRPQSGRHAALSDHIRRRKAQIGLFWEAWAGDSLPGATGPGYALHPTAGGAASPHGAMRPGVDLDHS